MIHSSERHSLRAAIRTIVAALAAACALTASAVSQNPASDNVVFLHGLLSNEHSWEQTANRLAQEYRLTPYRPYIEWWHHESEQAANLTQYLAPYPTGFAAVAKSNGAIVARTYLQNPGKVNRLVTVAGPNLGAPLADNVLTGRVFAFPYQVNVDLFDALAYYGTYETRIPDLLSYFINALVTVGNVFSYLGEILSSYGFVEAAASAFSPVGQELSPASAVIQNLNSATGLQHETTNAPIRAGVRAFFGYPRDILFYTMLNGNAATFSDARWITAAVAIQLFQYYQYDLDFDVPNYGYLHAGAYRWQLVFWDMVNIDPYWLDMIGVLHRDPSGALLYDESDGIVPEVNAVLPGTSNQCEAGPTSHQILNNNESVIQCIEQVFTLAFQIPLRTTPVNSVVVSPSPAAVLNGGTAQLTATPYDVLGAVVPGKSATWSSSNTAVVTVNASGIVTGHSIGTATISATIDGYAGSTPVTVTQGASVSIGGPLTVFEQYATLTATAAPSTPYYYVWTYKYCRNGEAPGDCDNTWHPKRSGMNATSVQHFISQYDQWVDFHVVIKNSANGAELASDTHRVTGAGILPPGGECHPICPQIIAPAGDTGRR